MPQISYRSAAKQVNYCTYVPYAYVDDVLIVARLRTLSLARLLERCHMFVASQPG